MTRLRLRDSAGFTLIEVMVASLILIIGAGAAFSLIDSANRAVTSNAARSGASNLGRELTEYARTTDYDLLQPTQVVTALRKHTQIAGTLSGGVWKITRRNVVYTVTTDTCTFDDPKDGLAATPPPNPCPAAAAIAGVTVTDVNGDDFRRVKYTLSWTMRGRAGSMTQQAAIVNPAGALGPRIDTFDEPPVDIPAGTNTVDWGAAYPLKLTTKTSAASVHWSADDGVSLGDATGAGTSWGFTWNLGTAFDAVNYWVRDGAYTIQTQGFDSRGVPGEGKLKTVYVNRHIPAAIANLGGGWNDRLGVVDFRWDRNDERDIQGYKVTLSDGVTVVCSTTFQNTCTDTNAGSRGPNNSDYTYKVFAMDCDNLKAGTSCTRPGVLTPVTVKLGAVSNTAPSQPTGLTAAVVDGKPSLTWTAPSSITYGPVRFYRIYRDTGTNLSDRYDLTVTNDPTYVDPEPGATTDHRYWITAVDQNFNESPPSASVDTPAAP